MNRKHPIRDVLALSLLFSILCAAQEKGTWRAANKTARSITGDVVLGDEKLSINFASFPMAQIRSLTPAELIAAFNTDGAATGSGNLYRLSIPGTRKFLGKNTLCGSDETQWMVTHVVGKDLELAFYSGPTMPVFTPEAVANSTSLCGLFGYVR